MKYCWRNMKLLRDVEGGFEAPPPAIQTHKKTNPERIGLFVASLVEMNLRRTIHAENKSESAGKMPIFRIFNTFKIKNKGWSKCFGLPFDSDGR